jgi:hypothetical protein
MGGNVGSRIGMTAGTHVRRNPCGCRGGKTNAIEGSEKESEHK